MKCPKCRRGKLKFYNHKCIPGTIVSVYKCTDSNCTHQMSTPTKWEMGEMIHTIDLDVRQEMIDILSEQILKDIANDFSKGLEAISKEL